MLLSQVIDRLEKLKDKHGDLPVYSWDDTYMEEYELLEKMFHFYREGQNKKSNQSLPKRISIG